MGNYKCTKCDETASSKCARSRNVFPDDQLATMIGNCFHYEANRRLPTTDREREFMEGDEWVVTLTYRTFECQNEDEAIQRMIKTLTSYERDVIRRALCDHTWQLTSPTCEMGCCKRQD